MTVVHRESRALAAIVLYVLAAASAFVGAGGAFDWWNANAEGFAFFALGLYASGTVVSWVR
jgi:hypothetical protein